MISPIGETKLNNAFTLIEILLVLAITGIIIALAAPNFSKQYSRIQLNTTVDDLLRVGRWAQAMAIGQGRVYALTFSDDHHSYSLTRAKTPLENEAAGDLEDEADGQVNFEAANGSLGRAHAIPDAVHLDTDGDPIEFYPDGTIDPATIQLTAAGQKTVLSSTQVRGMLVKVDSE